MCWVIESLYWKRVKVVLSLVVVCSLVDFNLRESVYFEEVRGYFLFCCYFVDCDVVVFGMVFLGFFGCGV